MVHLTLLCLTRRVTNDLYPCSRRRWDAVQAMPARRPHFHVEWLLFSEVTDCFWPIPDCDQLHTSLSRRPRL